MFKVLNLSLPFPFKAVSGSGMLQCLFPAPQSLNSSPFHWQDRETPLPPRANKTSYFSSFLLGYVNLGKLKHLTKIHQFYSAFLRVFSDCCVFWLLFLRFRILCSLDRAVQTRAGIGTIKTPHLSQCGWRSKKAKTTREVLFLTTAMRKQRLIPGCCREHKHSQSTQKQRPRSALDTPPSLQHEHHSASCSNEKTNPSGGKHVRL